MNIALGYSARKSWISLDKMNVVGGCIILPILVNLATNGVLRLNTWSTARGRQTGREVKLSNFRYTKSPHPALSVNVQRKMMQISTQNILWVFGISCGEGRTTTEWISECHVVIDKGQCKKPRADPHNDWVTVGNLWDKHRVISHKLTTDITKTVTGLHTSGLWTPFG